MKSQMLIECKMLKNSNLSFLKHSDVVFVLLMIIKMPTVIDILTLMNRINFMFELTVKKVLEPRGEGGQASDKLV